MYHPNHIVDVCYEQAHLARILTEIKSSFAEYFKSFLETKRFESIIRGSINEFEKDIQSYLDILDADSLEEYADDPNNFKNSVLKNSCPIIRLTLQNKKAKELDKYRAAFSRSEPKT